MDGNVMIWDLAVGQPKAVLSGELMSYAAIALSPDGRRLAAYGVEGAITLWDTSLKHPLRVGALPSAERSQQLVFSEDGNSLVMLGNDSLRIWHAPALTEIEAIEKVTGKSL
jgi:WD40 repeat protein